MILGFARGRDQMSQIRDWMKEQEADLIDKRYYSDEQVKVLSFLADFGGAWHAEDIADAIGWDYWPTYRTLRELEAEELVASEPLKGDYAFRATL